MLLGVQVESAGEWTIVHVRGEIDMATAPRLRQALVGAMRDEKPHVVVDLDGVLFVDSTGLGVLIGALVRARRSGGDLVLSGLARRLSELFSLVGLDKVFTVVDLASLPRPIAGRARDTES
jgi:anti-sigma B factor antagonist